MKWASYEEYVQAGSPYYRCPVCDAGDVEPFTCTGRVVPGDPSHRLRRARRVTESSPTPQVPTGGGEA